MSRSMRGESPRKPHLLPSKEGGIAAEILDLRDDVDRSFGRVEAELDAYSVIKDKDTVVLSGQHKLNFTGAGVTATLDGVDTKKVNVAIAGGAGLGTATPAAVGTAAPGSATAGSHEDHVHAHGNQASNGTLHAAVIAGGAAGFMTGADKTKLDGMGGVLVQDIFYVGPTGSDTTGNGSEGQPFATLQKCYNTWFPTGTPTTWAEFDRKRMIRVLPGTTAAGSGNLAAACCNLVSRAAGQLAM